MEAIQAHRKLHKGDNHDFQREERLNGLDIDLVDHIALLQPLPCAIWRGSNRVIEYLILLLEVAPFSWLLQ